MRSAQTLSAVTFSADAAVEDEVGEVALKGE